jgi:hypothetical protein
VPKLNELNDTKNLPTLSAKHEKQTIPQMAGLKPAREKRKKNAFASDSFRVDWRRISLSNHDLQPGQLSQPGAESAREAQVGAIALCGIGTKLGSWEPD